MPEKEYIERDSVYNVINEAMTAGMVDVYTATQRRSDFEEALEAIELVPTADVQPVKHGLWKGYTKSAFYGCDDEGEPIYRDANFNVCSECGRKTVVKEKFCPNCGAKMDGGDG